MSDLFECSFIYYYYGRNSTEWIHRNRIVIQLCGLHAKTVQWHVVSIVCGSVTIFLSNTVAIVSHFDSYTLQFLRLMVSGNGIPPHRTLSELKSRKMSDKGIQYELPAEMMELTETQVNHCIVAEINTSICETTTLPVVSNHRPKSTESLQSDPDKRRTLCEDEDEICIQPVSSSEVKLDEDKVDSTDTRKEDSNVQEKPEETSCGIECLYFTMQCCECTIL